jgi:hypothetical protein
MTALATVPPLAEAPLDQRRPISFNQATPHPWSTRVNEMRLKIFWPRHAKKA